MKKRFLGRWGIVDMDRESPVIWKLMGPPFVSFRADGTGRLKFIEVDVKISWRLADVLGQPMAEFKVEGDNDGRPAKGRGWAHAEGEEIEGKVFFDDGDEYAFKARKERKGRAAPGP